MPREVQADDLAHALGAGEAALVGIAVEAQRAAVAVRRGGEGDARHVGAAALLAAELPVTDRVA